MEEKKKRGRPRKNPVAVNPPDLTLELTEKIRLADEARAKQELKPAETPKPSEGTIIVQSGPNENLTIEELNRRMVAASLSYRKAFLSEPVEVVEGGISQDYIQIIPASEYNIEPPKK